MTAQGAAAVPGTIYGLLYNLVLLRTIISAGVLPVNSCLQAVGLKEAWESGEASDSAAVKMAASQTST